MHRVTTLLVSLSIAACSDNRASNLGECADLDPGMLLSQVRAELDPLLPTLEGREVRADLEAATLAVKQIAYKAEECFYFYGEMPRGELQLEQRQIYSDRMHGFLDISTGLRWVISNLEANASYSATLVGTPRDWKYSYGEFLAGLGGK